MPADGKPMSGQLLRLLHWLGLTNLTDEEVRRYVSPDTPHVVEAK